jgi:hypothetical protein
MPRVNKANIRRKFKIKGNEWRVFFAFDLRNDIGEKVDGLCDPTKRTIFIERTVKNNEKWDIFFHELIHAIHFETHATEDGGVDGFLGEVLAEGMTQVLHDLFLIQWRGARIRQTKGIRKLGRNG